ncbi:MAG: histidine kinase [Microbacterium sp.]
MTRVGQPSLRPEGRHSRLRPWIGDAVAAGFIISSAFVPFPDTQFRPADLLTLALVVAPAVILPLRRRWPLPALVACLALYALAAFTGTLWPGIVLAIAIAMFGVGNRSPRSTTLMTALATIIAVILINVLASLGSVLDPRVFAVAITLAFAAAAGDGTRSRREYIAAITERAERAEETRESEARRRVSEERLRIARDLHDAVAHQIAVISLNAGVASSAIETRPAAAQEAVRTIRSAARTVLGEIGALLEVLRTEDDAEGGISPQPGLERLDDLVGQFVDAGLAVSVRTEGDPFAVGAATSRIAYRVIQEGLTNAHKHGAEARAHVLIQADDDVLCIIVTNPVATATASTDRGPAVGEVAAGSGLGLIGLRERVAALRGVVEAGPTRGGWRLAATLPMTRKADG